jgi:hypothetical protein
MKFSDWIKRLDESSARYSVEVNYRTKTKEVLESFAKIALGYVSAGMKKKGYHARQIFDEKPIRILVSSRNWDDGEWVGMISYSLEKGCFIMSNGFYNKDRKTISIQRSERCNNDTPAEMVKDLTNMIHKLKSEPDRHTEKLNPVRLKRGPKK